MFFGPKGLDSIESSQQSNLATHGTQYLDDRLLEVRITISIESDAFGFLINDSSHN